jgi:LEA14-like dessication related protein
VADAAGAATAADAATAVGAAAPLGEPPAGGAPQAGTSCPGPATATVRSAPGAHLLIFKTIRAIIPSVTINRGLVKVDMVPRRRSVVWPHHALLAACLAVAACTPHFEKPVLSVTKIEFRGGNFLQQEFQVSFNIHNPNARTLPVSGLEARLSVDGDAIASGSSSRSFVVPAMGDGQFDMTIKADMATGLLKLLSHNDALNYEVTGTVRIDLPFLRALPFRQSGILPLGGGSH